MDTTDDAGTHYTVRYAEQVIVEVDEDRPHELEANNMEHDELIAELPESEP